MRLAFGIYQESGDDAVRATVRLAAGDEPFGGCAGACVALEIGNVAPENR
jgi:hypothetical protein